MFGLPLYMAMDAMNGVQDDGSQKQIEYLNDLSKTCCRYMCMNV